MASAEDSGHLQPPASTLPPYPELIVAAIDALNDPNGSNKTTISRHIESLYPNLPSSHTTLLTHHLNRMKRDGDLVLVKNNYMRPDQDAPPKRGRGRPRKNAEPTLPCQAAPSLSLRPRGRPPKSGGSEAPPQKPKPSASGKKRGRPRKEKGAVSSGSEPEAVASTDVAGVGGVVKRGRGRPPKAKAAAVPVGA